MKYVYQIKNLTCAHCAARIESEIQSLNGVETASLNVVTQKLIIITDERSINRILKEAKSIIHKIEPEASIVEGEDASRGRKIFPVMRIAISLILLIALTFIDIAYPADFILYLIPYFIVGADVIISAVGNIFRGQIFDEKFLMTVATFGAFTLGEYREGVAVMLFYQLGELFQSIAVGKSRRSISEMMDIKPDTATVLRDGKELKVRPEEVDKGEIILVKPGEKIPLDATVTEGTSTVNTAALTGESMPCDAGPGDTVVSGTVNLTGILKARVTGTYAESTVSRILDLVENASEKKAHVENFISRFARWYTPCVVIGAVFLAVIPPLMTRQPFGEWISRALTFLVVSCPCALVISIPLSFFGGIGGASRKGILIKGAEYIESLSKAETFVFDKTGTLTKGNFAVTGIYPMGISEGELVETAAYAECFSNHPIAASIKKAYEKDLMTERILDAKEIPGEGTEVTIDGKTVYAGNEKLMRRLGVPFVASDRPGTIVHIAVENNYFGSLLISDEIKDEAKESIEKSRSLGVRRMIMLTGDRKEVGEATCRELGLDEAMCELLPEGKVDALDSIISKGSSIVCYVGDGINDAPVLMRADVGVAMGALGSDAAIEAADVVIMNDSMERIPEAVRISKKTMRIVKQNVVFTLAVKAFVLILGAAGIAGMWLAVFADVGVMVLAVLNAMRTLCIQNE